MPTYFITGLAGSGKTTLLAELTDRGYATLDADAAPGVAGWVDQATGKLVAEWSEQQSTAPDGCAWGWDNQRITNIARNPSAEPFFFGGNGPDANKFYPLFKQVFALVADTDILLERLRTRTSNPNNYGKDPKHIAAIAEENKHYSHTAATLGAVIITGTGTVQSIADTLLTYCHET